MPNKRLRVPLGYCASRRAQTCRWLKNFESSVLTEFRQMEIEAQGWTMNSHCPRNLTTVVCSRQLTLQDHTWGTGPGWLAGARTTVPGDVRRVPTEPLLAETPGSVPGIRRPLQRHEQATDGSTREVLHTERGAR